MNAVERIKELCKKKGIAISKLERDCGFSNGYISQLRKGTMPYERLITVAEYFGVSPDYLMSGDNVDYTIRYDKDTLDIASNIKNDEALRLLMYAALIAKKEDIDFAREFLERMKDRI